PTWEIVKPDNLKGRPANPKVVLSILMAVNRPLVLGVENEKASASDLAAYGLDKPQRVVVTETKDKKDTKHEVLIGKEAGPARVYEKRAGQDVVYVVQSTLLVSMKEEVRDTTIFRFDEDKVKSVKLTGWQHVDGAPRTYTLEKSGDAWALKEDK